MAPSVISPQAAGQVMRSAKNADRHPVPTLKIVDQSNKNDLLKYLDKDFREEIERILLTAGFGGKFTLHATKRVKGSSGALGLHIGNPQGHGVRLLYQGIGAGNGNRVEVIIFPPANMDPFIFHQKLVKGRELLATLEDQDEAPEETPVAEPLVSDVTVEAEEEETSSTKLSVGDCELLVGTLVSDGSVDSEGVISRRHVLDFLGTEFGIEGRARGPVLRVLCNPRRKFLTPVDDVDLKVHKRFFTQSSVEEETKELPVPPKAGAPTKPESVKTRLGRLARRASLVDRYEKRKSELSGKIEQSTTLIKTLEIEKAAWEAELEKIERKLEDSDLQGAKEKYEDVLKLLD